jgi:hypothetical protein
LTCLGGKLSGTGSGPRAVWAGEACPGRPGHILRPW